MITVQDEMHWEVEVQLHLFLTLALYSGELSFLSYHGSR